jgi:hypothetical protein
MSDSPVWVDQSPKALGQGSTPTYTLVYGGANSVSTVGAIIEVYKNGTGSDLSSTMTTGAFVASGNSLTLKTIQNLVGGNNYVVYIYALVDGVPTTRKLLLQVQKKGSIQ